MLRQTFNLSDALISFCISVDGRVRIIIHRFKGCQVHEEAAIVGPVLRIVQMAFGKVSGAIDAVQEIAGLVTEPNLTRNLCDLLRLDSSDAADRVSAEIEQASGSSPGPVPVDSSEVFQLGLEGRVRLIGRKVRHTDGRLVELIKRRL